ncbi:STAS domain-containing protein [Mycobacterium sp. 050272]|uniref:STAS domain-containing protein n=1 Tax=Mycobacterium sp. 050272 TaxID=3142488 RepID=UPI0031940116
MPAELTLNTDHGPDGTPRVTATGEIDLSNVARLVEALNTASAGSRSPIIIDLSTVKYLDSAGINALFDHADKVDGLHVVVHRLLIRVLTITGLDKVATLEAAPAGDDG